jgi:hypothetical protein
MNGIHRSSSLVFSKPDREPQIVMVWAGVVSFAPSACSPSRAEIKVV